MNLMVEQLKELINIQKNMFSQPDTKDNLVRIIEDGTSGIRLTVPVQTSGNSVPFEANEHGIFEEGPKGR